MIIVGERINSTRESIERALQADDLSALLKRYLTASRQGRLDLDGGPS